MIQGQEERYLRAKANERAARALDEIEANVAVLDHQGVILITNKAWRDFVASNPLANGIPPRNVEIGTNYLSVCLGVAGESSEEAMIAYDGIRAVLDGRKRSFSLEYPCHSPEKRRWFLMKVKPLRRSKPKEAVVIHVDITYRRVAEMELLARQRELSGALAQLHLMAGRIKNSVGLDWPIEGDDAAFPQHAPAIHQSQSQGEATLLKRLSKRELEVLIGLARGERNSAIASRLQLSKKSVSTYRSRVLEKLKVESNAQLAAFVSRAEALQSDSSLVGRNSLLSHP